jgi:hypothetical protein
VVAAVAVAAALVLLLVAGLAVAGWIADSRRARVPDSVIEEVSAAVPVVADLQVTNPTSAHYERYLVVGPRGSTRDEQRRSVTEALRPSGWEFDQGTPPLASKDGTGLLLTDIAAVRADDASLAARLDDRIPSDVRGQPPVVLVLAP